MPAFEMPFHTGLYEIQFPRLDYLLVVVRVIHVGDSALDVYFCGLCHLDFVNEGQD